MSKWTRPAEVNSKLITVLVIAVMAAGIYWFVKARSGGDDVPTVAVETYDLFCSVCGEISKVPATEAKGREKRDGKLQCPLCGKWGGTWGEPKDVGGLVAP